MTEKSVLVKSARLALIKSWNDSGENADSFVAAVKERTISEGIIKRLSPPTLYRWKKVLEDSGPEALAPGYSPERGAGARTLTQRDRALIQHYYLHQNKLTLAKVVDLIERSEGRRISYRTALRYVQSLPPALLAQGRYGSKKLNDRFLPYVERDYTLLRSMQMVTSDHHCMDFLVTDGGKVFRPWVTIFTDIRSRKPLGWIMSTSPSGYTILAALEMVIDEYGVMETLLLDNGKDYRSELLNGVEVIVPDWEDGMDRDRKVVIQGIFAALECSVIFCEPYHGQSKPVERFFKDVAENFSKTFPTYLGSNTATRPEDARLFHSTVGKLKKREVVTTFQEAKVRWENFIREWSATHKHSGQGMDGKTPDQVFAENWSLKRILPADKKDAIFVRTFTRQVGRQGIKIDEAYYWAAELIAWVGRKVLAKRPLSDISRLYVHDLDGRFLCEALPDQHIDRGMPEENIQNVKRNRKKAKAVLEQYREYLEDGKRNQMTAIEEASCRFKPTAPIKAPEDQEIRKVAGGIEVPTAKGRPSLTVVKKEKADKASIVGLLD